MTRIEAWLVNSGRVQAIPGHPGSPIGATSRASPGRLAVLEDLGQLGDVGLPDLQRSALRAAFSSWASDHAAASVRRAHSAWSSLFDFLVAEGVIDGNPMAAVPKPKAPTVLPRSIGLATPWPVCCSAASEVDSRARNPWPARDLAVIATFCVTGIREAEAAGLDVGSLSGEPGARRMEVRGKGGKVRPIPIDATLDLVLTGYQRERADRFPKHDLDHPGTPLFVDVAGRRMSVDQIRYLVEKLYVRAGITGPSTGGRSGACASAHFCHVGARSRRRRGRATGACWVMPAWKPPAGTSRRRPRASAT
jgi:site-specific recombinase XerD